MNAQPIKAAPHANLARLIVLANIGELTLTHHRASVATGAAKVAYHQAIKAYECGEGRIHPGGPGWDELKAETAAEYAAYQTAKRAASKIKGRLDSACRKAVHP